MRERWYAIWAAMASGENSWLRISAARWALSVKGTMGLRTTSMARARESESLGATTIPHWCVRTSEARADSVSGDDGAAEDERFHQHAGEGVEEGGDDDDTGQLDLAGDFVGTDFAEIVDARAGKLDAGGFLGFLPAPDEAIVVFGEIADDDKV